MTALSCQDRTSVLTTGLLQLLLPLHRSLRVSIGGYYGNQFCAILFVDPRSRRATGGVRALFSDLLLAWRLPIRRLHQLVQTLDYDERQTAYALLQHRNDILTRLPVELILEVFHYLDLTDTWKLQLVNRRWRQVLASEQFLRATLARWDTHAHSDSARTSESVAGDTTCEKIQHSEFVGIGIDIANPR